MDLEELGMEYLQDAAVLKAYLVQLKAQFGETAGDNRIFKWRVDTLYRMYLECRHTGEDLVDRERRKKREQIPYGNARQQ